MIISYYKNKKLLTSSTLENDDYKIIDLSHGNRTIIKIIPKTEITLNEAKIIYDYPYQKDDLIYLNGYQSWTDTKEFTPNSKLHSLKHLPKKLVAKFHFDAYGDSAFLNYQKNVLHSFTYSYIKAKDKTTLFGSYNMANAYLVIKHLIKKKTLVLESDVKNLIIKSEFILFDYIQLEGIKDDIINTYLSLFKAPHASKIKGYTSWYNHYQNINEDLIKEDLAGITCDSYDLFQIDDGYQVFVGDWLKIDSKKFPNGLTEIVKKIHFKKLKAGIWLAPFVAETNSYLFKEHPEFFYYENGKPVYAGCNWSGQLVLDFRRTDVKEYLKKVFNYFCDLGFDLFKLDFLYAITLIKDPYKTRSALMQEAMLFLRDLLKDKLIIGCGVPLANAFSNVDYCRIGPDVSLIFDDVFFMRIMHRERISTKVTIQNTIYRSHLDGKVFLNDPDVYLLRDDNIKLNKKQKEALILINHLCGSVYFTSDNVKTYTEDKLLLLEKARHIAGAKLLDIKTVKKQIYLTYSFENKIYNLIYNTQKGVVING